MFCSPSYSELLVVLYKAIISVDYIRLLSSLTDMLSSTLLLVVSSKKSDLFDHQAFRDPEGIKGFLYCISYISKHARNG